MSIEEQKRWIQARFDEEGLGRTVEAEILRVRAEGLAHTSPSAINYLMQEMALDVTELPKFESCVLTVRTEPEDGIGSKPMAVVTGPEGLLSLQSIPSGFERFAKVSLTGIEKVADRTRPNAVPFCRWGAKSQMENGGKVTMADLEKVFSPIQAVQGPQRWFLVRGHVQYVNPPIEDFDPTKPKVKGQRPKELPFITPEGFKGLTLVVAQGEQKLNIKLKTMQQLESLFPYEMRTEFKESLEPFLNRGDVSIADKLEEVRRTVGNSEVVILGRGGNQLRARGSDVSHTVQPFLAVGLTGWVYNYDYLEGLLKNGGEPSSTEETLDEKIIRLAKTKPLAAEDLKNLAEETHLKVADIAAKVSWLASKGHLIRQNNAFVAV